MTTNFQNQMQAQLNGGQPKEEVKTEEPKPMFRHAIKEN
jgi:hypothetical protein